MNDDLDREGYARFMARCEIHFPHSECVRVSVAYKLAKFSHRHDVRKDEVDSQGRPLRYFEHIRRTGLIALDEVGLVDVEVILTIIFHDTVEDTRISPEEITLVAGVGVSRRVMLVSKVPKVGFLDRLRRDGDWKVLAVKVCDRLDNLRSLENSKRTFIEKQLDETEAEYFGLAQQMVEKAPVDVRARCEHLASLLRAEVAAQRARLEVSASA
jgi:(p)ppGpp synthase/HD superfamily hydrolase